MPGVWDVQFSVKWHLGRSVWPSHLQLHLESINSFHCFKVSLYVGQLLFAGLGGHPLGALSCFSILLWAQEADMHLGAPFSPLSMRV